LKLNRLAVCRLPVEGNSKPRIAQLTAGCSFDSAEVFTAKRWSGLESWAPNALIGSAADLQRLTDRVRLGTIELKTLDHSISVLTAVGDEPLSDSQREMLWDCFGVPVYELYTDESRILAYECEAHEGWHITPGSPLRTSEGELLFGSSSGKSLPTGLQREMDNSPCRCGRAGARLVVPSEDRRIRRPILEAIA
jgi:hypothetical protein